MNNWMWRWRWWHWRPSPDVLTFWMILRLTGWWSLKCCQSHSSRSRSPCWCSEADWPARFGCQCRQSCLCCPPRHTSCTSPLPSPPVSWSATAGRCSPWWLSLLCVFSVSSESSISRRGRRACWVLRVRCGGQNTTEDREITCLTSPSHRGSSSARQMARPTLQTFRAFVWLRQGGLNWGSQQSKLVIMGWTRVEQDLGKYWRVPLQIFIWT